MAEKIIKQEYNVVNLIIQKKVEKEIPEYRIFFS